jgi:hypothetical protein
MSLSLLFSLLIFMKYSKSFTYYTVLLVILIYPEPFIKLEAILQSNQDSFIHSLIFEVLIPSLQFFDFIQILLLAN